MKPHTHAIAFVIATLVVSSCAKKPVAVTSPSNAPSPSPETLATPVMATLNPEFEDNAETQASEQADKVWRATVMQCGSDSHYFAMRNTNIGRFTYYECKHMSGPVLQGEVYSPRTLTEAERLNRVDPLPVQYQGRSVMTFQTCREFVSGSGGYDSSAKFHEGWTAWYDAERSVQINLTKAKNHWTYNAGLIGETSEQLAQMKCSDLTDIEKRIRQ